MLARISSFKSVTSVVASSSKKTAVAKASAKVCKASQPKSIIQSRWYAQGAVKWFNTEKGYGFVCPEDGSADLFVHVTSINGTGFKVLNEGDIITYDTEERSKGIVAVNVNVIQPNPNPPRRRAPRAPRDDSDL